MCEDEECWKRAMPAGLIFVGMFKRWWQTDSANYSSLASIITPFKCCQKRKMKKRTGVNVLWSTTFKQQHPLMWHYLNSKLRPRACVCVCVHCVFLVECCVLGSTWKIRLPFESVMVIYFEPHWVRQITHYHSDVYS